MTEQTFSGVHGIKGYAVRRSTIMPRLSAADRSIDDSSPERGTFLNILPYPALLSALPAIIGS